MKKTCSRVLMAIIASTAMTGGMFSHALPTQALEISAAPETTITQKSGSLTLHEYDLDKKPLAGASFSIYKVMSLTPGGTLDNYVSYTIEDDFKDVLKDITPDALGNYSTKELEELGKELSDKAAKIDALQEGTSDASGTITFNDLSLGYYLVVETQAPSGYVSGRPFLIAIPSSDNYQDDGQQGTHWIYDVEATPKNEQVSIDKDIIGTSDGSVKVGDHVQYQVKTKMPDYDDSYFGNKEHPAVFDIIDTMEDGLAIQKDVEHPITVTVGDQVIAEGETTYTLSAENKTGEDPDMIISFKEAFIKENGGKDVTVTYYAQVTEKAVQGQAGNENAASLRYDHKPQEITTSEKDTEKVYSFGIKVEKFTKEEDPRALSDAEFTLLASDGSDILGSAVTDEMGNLQFHNLDAGTYYLKETRSPAGYTLLAEPIKVEIIADVNAEGKATGSFTLKVNDKDVTTTTGEFTTQLDDESGTTIIAVENHKGFTLPSTGGAGISVFLIIGGIGILGISVVMMKKNKKQA